MAGITEVRGSHHTKAGAIYDIFHPRTDIPITDSGGGVQYNGDGTLSTTLLQFDFGHLTSFLNTTAVIQFDASVNSFTISGEISNDGNTWTQWFSQTTTGAAGETFEFFISLGVYRFLRFKVVGSGTRANIKALIAIPDSV